MAHPTLSVVIPTHKRADILRQTLDHLAAQTIRDQLEVIVISDGPDAATQYLFRSGIWPMPVRFIEIPKSHQGAARNRGVQEATGKIILFIGDDIFLESTACEKHLEAHIKSQTPRIKSTVADLETWDLEFPPTAVLGFTTWDPALTVTPVMLWLEKTGWQFGYPMIEKYAHDVLPSEIQHRFTYTSHISLPLSVAHTHPFREDVSLYGWEDIEWGMRLKSAGIPLLYEPDAKAFHHHPLTLEQSLQRMETLGESAVRLGRIVPELDRVPRGIKRMAYRVLALLPTMRGKHAKAFMQGIQKAQHI